MLALNNLLGEGRLVARHRPFARALVTETIWRRAIEALAGGEWALLALWGEPKAVHLAAYDPNRSEVGVLSLACPEGRYPSVGARHPPAIRLERAIADLFGLDAEGLPDKRPWLDHGRWGLRHPPLHPPVEGEGRRQAPAWGGTLGASTTPGISTPSRRASPGDLPPPGGGEAPAPPYAFLPAEGESLHQIPVGPVHAGIIEPGHFRFTANGETVVRLEERLGYVHKGIEGLMQGADLDQGARLAGRTSGDSTVAYAFAFARAAEAALRVEAPARAVYLRALMAELERIANHFGDIGAICNDASFVLMHAHCGVLRERVLRLAGAAFGHRLMMDAVVPGGVAADLSPDAAAALVALVDDLRRSFPRLVNLYDSTASLQDRTVGTGTLRPALARQFAPGGYVGRASGRAFDARRTIVYPPYDALRFDVPALDEGDVNARVWIRIREVEQSLSLIEQILAALPAGPIRIELPAAAGEGLGIVEGFRGDVLAWLRIGEDGRIARCHLRDPSWFQWPLLEAVIEGNIVADFPLCNKSFNCSYSGHDL